MAGKRVKCPACAHVWQVPRQVVDAEAVPGTPGGAAPTSAAKKGESFDDMMSDEYPIAASQNFSGGTPGTPFSSSAAEPARRPCPRCGEMIAIGAAKCRFCDAIFDSKLRKSKKKKKGGSSFTSDDDDLTPLDWLLCIFCGNIACIVGIVYLCLGKPKAGKMIIVAICLQILWGIFWAIIQAVLISQQHGGLH
jgi:ribosomal protein L40E